MEAYIAVWGTAEGIQDMRTRHYLSALQQAGGALLHRSHRPGPPVLRSAGRATRREAGTPPRAPPPPTSAAASAAPVPTPPPLSCQLSPPRACPSLRVNRSYRSPAARRSPTARCRRRRWSTAAWGRPASRSGPGRARVLGRGEHSRVCRGLAPAIAARPIRC